MLSSKLAAIEAQYHDLETRLADPEVIRSQETYQKLRKEHAELTPLVQAFRRYKQVEKELADSQSLLKDDTDEELRALAREEIEAWTGTKVYLELFVKVRTDWRQNPRMLRDLEYS